MTLLILMYAAVAVLSSALCNRWGRFAFALPALLSAVAAVWVAMQAPVVFAGERVTESLPWVPAFSLSLDFSMGALGWMMAMIVTGVGALIFGYCCWYFETSHLASRTVGLLTGFAGSMFGLVVSDDIVLLVIFWELTTVFSYLLVGLNHHSAKNRNAAYTALVVTTIGGLSLLIGAIMLASEAGTTSLTQILEVAPHSQIASVAVFLAVVGALAKSAIVPFQFWLPGAMAAPTPVSAFLHAAAMVKAGIFLVAVLTPAFADLPWWRPTLVVLGVATMLLGAVRALKQLDIKVLLAHGTVSQLGLLMTTVGIGTSAALQAGMTLLIAHALFKAALFMTVGVVDRSTGTRELTALGGLGKSRPVLAGVAILAASAMAGLPPTIGFLGKEAALGAALEPILSEAGTGSAPTWIGVLAFAGIAFGAALTLAYTLRYIIGVFFGPVRTEPSSRHSLMTLFPILLASTALVFGFLGKPLATALAPATDSVQWGETASYLALWHGITVPLVTTIIALTLGVCIYLVLGRKRATPKATDPLETGFQSSLHGLDRLAVEVTGRLQTGSLPIYIATIFVVVALVPGGVLLATGALTTNVYLTDSVAQLITGIAIIVATIFVVNTRGRLKAFMLLGIVGYGVALLFALHGAPDLALTQTLCETVVLVLLVLVLRRQPKYFTHRPLRHTRWINGLIAIAVGAMATMMAITALGARTADPISSDFPKWAYEFGYGRNIVNVTLVDIRAWDTMGELAVLVVAATGVASLIFIRTRSADPRGTLKGDRGRPSTAQLAVVSERQSYLRGGRGIDEYTAAPVLEMIVRIIFPLVMLASIWLLFVGHNLPGGGFAGGLVGGLAVAMRYLAAGRDELAEAMPYDAGRLLGSGAVIAGLALLWPILIGGSIGQSYAIDFTLPLLGEQHLVTTVFFDIGVWLIVVGAMLDFMRSLGSGIDVQARRDEAPMPVRDSDRATPGSAMGGQA